MRCSYLSETKRLMPLCASSESCSFPKSPKRFWRRRVLRPGGIFIFNVWDRITEIEFADTVTTALESLFPKDPPCFLARTPHGYHDHRIIERDLANGRFIASARTDTVAARSRATSPGSQRSRTVREHR